MTRIIFVCTANRIRSPMAEALFRRAIGDSPVDVTSAGTAAIPGLPAMPEAVAVAREQDVDLSGHRSRDLAQVHPASADLVVCFEWRHMAAAVVEGGADRRRTIRLIELVDALQRAAPLPKGDLTERVSNLAALAAPHREPDRSDPAFDLPDPLGGSEGLYRRTLEEISALCTRLAALILEGTPGNRT